MAFLLDPRWHTDPWVRRISVHAKLAFVLFLTGQFRKRIPGLCFPVAPELLSAAMGADVTVDAAESALDELIRPDRSGSQHVFYDADHLVLRIPRAPAYNQADNGNVLVAWYREWRETPECDLKWDHIASLRSGVNFGKETIVKAWEDTFREPEEAFARGERLKSYVALAEKRSRRDRKRSRDPEPEQGRLPLGTASSEPPPEPVTLVTRVRPVPTPQALAVPGTLPTLASQNGPRGHLSATEPGVQGGVAGGVATRGENAPDGRPQAAANGESPGAPPATRKFRLPPGVE